MTAVAAPPPPSTNASRGVGFLDRFRREPNAIWMREMRQSARLGRTPWILGISMVALGAVLVALTIALGG